VSLPAFPGNMGPLRLLQRDESIKKHKLPAGLVRRVLRFSAPYRWRLIVFLLLIVLDTLINVAYPLIFRKIIDDGILKRDTRLVMWLAILSGSLAVADAGLTLWQRWISVRIGEGLVFDMRSKVFGKILEMPIAFFAHTKTGALISRLNNDVLGARQAFTDTFSSVLGSLAAVGFTLGAMALLSWQITLLSLVVLPIFICSARWASRRVAATTREYYNVNSEMNVAMAERFNVAGAMLVKLYGHRGEAADLSAKAARVRDIGIVQAMYARIFMASLLLTASLSTALVYGWGGILAVHRVFEVGTVVALATYLTRLYGPLTQLSNVQLDIMTALVSFDRVFEVLDLPSLVTEKDDARPVPRGMATVEFDHVHFTYPAAAEVAGPFAEASAAPRRDPAEPALSDISFRALPGEVIALVGPSGAGKSTIGHLVARLYDVSSGAVRLNGTDVRDATLDSIRACVGVVSQDAHLFHDTLRANLLYAKPGATEAELEDALYAAQILPLVDSLPDGLQTVVGDRGYRLSGGQKQRIAIARMLLKAPDIVVLDEATAHLDPEAEEALQRALRSGLAGRTSLVIAHRLSTIRQADLILVISEGRIVERGTHAELLAADGRYAELYRKQFRRQDGDGMPAGLDEYLERPLAEVWRPSLGRHRRTAYDPGQAANGNLGPRRLR
jgi:ATP-binding cassette subfamily B protein